MLFSFSLERPDDIKSTFLKLKEELESHNGKLSGNDVSGSISSNGVEGTYVVEEDSIKIKIHKKPLLFPNSLIENEIRRIFRKVSV